MRESGEAHEINFTYIKNILKLFPTLKPLPKKKKKKILQAALFLTGKQITIVVKKAGLKSN